MNNTKKAIKFYVVKSQDGYKLNKENKIPKNAISNKWCQRTS